MPNAIIAAIRTFASIIVGASLTISANLIRRHLGWELPEVDPVSRATLITGVASFVSMLWYATFATLERRWPPFGVFLGYPQRPHYDVDAEVDRRVRELIRTILTEAPGRPLTQSEALAWLQEQKGDSGGRVSS